VTTAALPAAETLAETVDRCSTQAAILGFEQALFLVQATDERAEALSWLRTSRDYMRAVDGAALIAECLSTPAECLSEGPRRGPSE
jgi:hypothetical protein